MLELLRVPWPGRFIICICEAIGSRRSMGWGRLMMATEAIVEEEIDISEESV